MFIDVTMGKSKQTRFININNIVGIQENDVKPFRSHIQTVSDNQFYNVLESRDEIIEKIQKARESDPLVHTINWLGSHISLLRETIESQKQCDCKPEQDVCSQSEREEI